MENVGHTYTDENGTYYSLFGQTYKKDDKDLKAVKNIDKAIIEYIKYKAFYSQKPSSNKKNTDPAIEHEPDIKRESPDSYFGGAYEFKQNKGIFRLSDPYVHRLAYGEKEVNTTYRVPKVDENAYAHAITMMVSDKFGDYAGHHSEGICIRFINDGNYEPVSVVFKNKDVANRNVNFFNRLKDFYFSKYKIK